MVQWEAHQASGEPWIVVMPVIVIAPIPAGLQKIIGYASFEIMVSRASQAPQPRVLAYMHITTVSCLAARAAGELISVFCPWSPNWCR